MPHQEISRRVAELKTNAAASVAQDQRSASLQRARASKARISVEAEHEFLGKIWEALGWLSIAMDSIAERASTLEAMAQKRAGVISH